jgi:two-component system sporulation sensor kinase A
LRETLNSNIWKNNEFYHSLIEFNPDSIIFYDLDSQILRANPALSNLLGFSFEELKMIPITSLVVPEDHKKRNFHFQEASYGNAQEFKEVLINKYGQRVDVQIKYVPVIINGIIVGIHAIAKDITQQKKTQRELHQATERYESFFQHTSDAIGLTDENRIVLRVNPAFEKLFGWTQQEVVGKPSTVVPSGLETEISTFRRTLQSGGVITGVETQRIRKDGTLIDVSITYSPIHDESGKVVAYSASYRDISDRKEIEEALVEAEAKYRTLVEKALVGVYILQNDKFVYVNPRYAHMLGYTVEELIHMTPEELCFPEDRILLLTNMRKRLSGEINTSRYQLRGIKKDKTMIWVDILGTRITFQGEPAVIGTLVDITEIKKAEALLRKSDKLNMVGELAAGVAHELRNPLASIRGFIQLLQHGSDISPYASLILSEIDRINSITSEFLMLSKPQVVHYQSQEIRTIFRSVLSLIDTQASLNNVQIISDLGDDHLWVNCEANHIKQVFINVLKNAMDASPSGGKIFIELSTRKQMQEYALIRVIDQGCGIPEGRLAKLGEPFFTTKEKGTGLGLMISYKIIENHQGKISINSNENIGTTVEILLPLTNKKNS